MRLGKNTRSRWLGKGRAMSRVHPVVGVGVLTGCLWLVSGGPAYAFFPPLPLGTQPVTVIPPPTLPQAPPPDTDTVPVVPPPPFTPPPTRNVPQEVPPTPEVPQVVPEPASVVSAAAGLAALVAARKRRRNRQAEPSGGQMIHRQTVAARLQLVHYVHRPAGLLPIPGQ